MIDSRQIMQATGIKSAKTLTRWHNSGLIPKPTIGTSRSGRGKIAYWPDWVLDRCKRIVELQKQGHSPKSAATLIELERVNTLVEQVATKNSSSIGETKIKASDGSEVTLQELFIRCILQELLALVASDTLRILLNQLQELDALGLTFQLLKGGYNPVLVLERTSSKITADFAVSQWLSANHAHGSPCACLPLLTPLRRLFAAFGKPLPGPPPIMFPVSTIQWTAADGQMHQVDYVAAGMLGFEILRETERIAELEPRA
jgi:hypothetical protein